MRLHVEDELVAGKHALGRRRLERRLLGQPEHAAGIATRRQGLAQGQERGGRSAERLQERPPAGSHPACMLANPDTRLLVRPPHDFAQGHGPELAITSRVDLDWKDALVPVTGRHDIASLSRRPLAADVRNRVRSMPAGQPRPKPPHRPPRAWMSARQGRSSRSSGSSIIRWSAHPPRIASTRSVASAGGFQPTRDGSVMATDRSRTLKLAVPARYARASLRSRT